MESPVLVGYMVDGRKLCEQHAPINHTAANAAPIYLHNTSIGDSCSELGCGYLPGCAPGDQDEWDTDGIG